MVNKFKGLISNKSRICIDLRRSNSVLEPVPVVNLPKVSVFKERAFDSYLSSFDLTMFFYAIKLSQASKGYTNFWFDGQVFAHTALPMGLKSSPFFAQEVVENIFSTENLTRVLESENLTLNSPAFPFSGFSAYLPDLSILGRFCSGNYFPSISN